MVIDRDWYESWPERWLRFTGNLPDFAAIKLRMADLYRETA